MAVVAAVVSCPRIAQLHVVKREWMAVSEVVARGRERTVVGTVVDRLVYRYSSVAKTRLLVHEV